MIKLNWSYFLFIVFIPFKRQYMSGGTSAIFDVFKEKKSLVVFCFKTNLSYVCVEEYYGHTLSVCTSVRLLLSTNFLNVLTLIDTLKKITVQSQKRCIVNMIVICIACCSGKFRPMLKHAFPYSCLFSSALFCSKPCLQKQWDQVTPDLKFTDMPAYMPYLYKFIFNSRTQMLEHRVFGRRWA